MNRTQIPYHLVQEKTGKEQFAAAYVKYYPETPHCALFQDYPAESTTIWVCRKVDPQEQEYGYRLQKLISHGTGQDRFIGHYVKLFEAKTEREVEDRLIANLIGTAFIKSQI